MVSLANGQQVPWDEFSSWTASKQSASQRNLRENFDWRLKYSQKLSAIHHKKHEMGQANLVSSRGKDNASSRAVITPDGKFETLKTAAMHYGISTPTLSKWIRDDRYVGFKFVEEKPKYSLTKPVVVNTPNGQFKSKAAAARHFGVTVGVIKTWLSNVDGFSYADDFIQNESAFSTSKAVMTPDGHFKSISEAAKFYKVQANTISIWIRKSKPDFTYVEVE
jgi:transposase